MHCGRFRSPNTTYAYRPSQRQFAEQVGIRKTWISFGKNLQRCLEPSKWSCYSAYDALKLLWRTFFICSTTLALPPLREVGSVSSKPLNSPSSSNKSVFAKTFSLGICNWAATGCFQTHTIGYYLLSHNLYFFNGPTKEHIFCAPQYTNGTYTSFSENNNNSFSLVNLRTGLCTRWYKREQERNFPTTTEPLDLAYCITTNHKQQQQKHYFTSPKIHSKNIWKLDVSTIQDSELKVEGDKVPQSFAGNHQRSDRPQFHGTAILIPAPEYLDLT